MFFYEDYVLSYEELLQKAGKETMKVNRLRSLGVSFGGESLRYYGPKIWNLLSFHNWMHL